MRTDIDPYGEEDWNESNLYVEKVKNSKFAQEKSVMNGHDCWGNLEWNTEKYVFIKGKMERCFDDWYIVHDGKNVIDIVTDFMLKYKYKNETLQTRK